MHRHNDGQYQQPAFEFELPDCGWTVVIKYMYNAEGWHGQRENLTKFKDAMKALKPLGFSGDKQSEAVENRVEEDFEGGGGGGG